MVRISLSNRLKSYTGSNSNSRANSRATSPSPNSRRNNGGGSELNLDAAKANGLMLKVNVIRAENLAARDRNGTSDPYLVLTLGDSRNATHAVPKTLNPEWKTTMNLPINGVNCLLLDCVCWDKDRFGKDYLGEFDLPLEDIFTGDNIEPEPKWYKLKSKRKESKKGGAISGQVLLQFGLFDGTNLSATPEQVLTKFRTIAGQELTPTRGAQGSDDAAEYFDGTDIEEEPSPSDETDDPTKPENIEKRKRRNRLRGLRKKKIANAYEFTGGSDVVGIVFLEIGKIHDLPPERNMTRTSFDMDPFVVASLGKKTYRTRVIRHNLNPVFNEKMIFQVLRHEQAYSLSFTVIDRDKLSGNDFIASTVLSLQDILETAPEAAADTGLYALKEPPDATSMPLQQNRSRFKLPLSRSNSSQSLTRLSRPIPTPRGSSSNLLSSSPNSGTSTPARVPPPTSNPGGLAAGDAIPPPNAIDDSDGLTEQGDPDLHEFTIPLKLKNAEKWEEKHKPELFIKAKYVPYPALRQQFWRSMLKQYDSDESGKISKVELTTMLDTLGSTLKESTIDSFFQRFPHAISNGDDGPGELSFDEAVICLEDQLCQRSQAPETIADKFKHMLPEVKIQLPTQLGGTSAPPPLKTEQSYSTTDTTSSTPSSSENLGQSQSGISSQYVDDLGSPGEEGDMLDRSDDLNDKGEEHVVEIRECPICHQPRLNKRSDADIITHIATCASQDWRQVNNIVMAGFVTSSQAQRKWYSKVITKISYGGYKLGANSANILVQDRITGQINEERMSVYVRLGIRLLYKGLKSKDMEKKRIRKLLKSLSIKQGIKYDDPASKEEIEKFIAFHQLDMSEVLLPTEKFKSFNEFFYRQLKPDARPCSAPQNPKIIVSPADCRTVVFNRMDEATKIWVKGREFNIQRLLGNAYPEDAKRYVNGALGIFRLAPQDYHRFHIPVDGVMGTPKTIEGEYYTVNPMAIRSALDVYGENVRVVIPIDSVAHGRVMVICVGAMMVGSTVITRNGGENVKRAEELGYFKFGGSTILLLFEEGAMRFDDDLVDNSNTALETLVRVGMSIGHHPTEQQHLPDMRKKDSEITDKEKADARRRIEGSIDATADHGLKKMAATMAG